MKEPSKASSHIRLYSSRTGSAKAVEMGIERVQHVGAVSYITGLHARFGEAIRSVHRTKADHICSVNVNRHGFRDHHAKQRESKISSCIDCNRALEDWLHSMQQLQLCIVPVQKGKGHSGLVEETETHIFV